MAKNDNVSRIVSLHVSAADREIISASKGNRNRKQRSSGLYLVRSGNIYLFQIRIPKRLSSRGRSTLVRISLGPLAHKDARETADALAALARQCFREIEKRMTEDEALDVFNLLGLDNDSSAGDDWPSELISMFLKAGLYDLRSPPREPTPEEARGHELMRGMVKIAKEVSAKQAGEPYNDLIADNAETLVASHLAKFDVATGPVSLPDQLYSSARVPDAPGPEVKTNESDAEILAAEAGAANEVVAAGVQASDAGQVSAAVAPAMPAAAAPPGRPISATRLITSTGTPASKLDRRYVDRPPSSKPLFSVVASEYLANRRASKSDGNRDIDTAEIRLNLFAELIGDHPVDTYTGTDLQAFIYLMGDWPKHKKDQPANLTARQIIELTSQTDAERLAEKTLREGYIAVVKAAVHSGMTSYDYKSPFAGATLKYPETARTSVATEPLSYKKTERLLAVGAASEFLDEVMLPLLSLLTGRRLGLLIHLCGSDFREKFQGVWIAQTSGIVLIDGRWKRVPVKTPASTSFFVLHRFLVEIGFVEWAQSKGDEFLFPELIRLADPSRSASSYMGRLMKRAGVKQGKGEVFHSLRGAYISESRDQKVEKRDRQLQVGHEIGDDEHDKYGFKTLTEKQARMLANLPLNPEIDLSMFHGLDFNKLYAAERTRGRKPNAKPKAEAKK
nr:putative integrase/resolvase recombinase protein [Rhizobium sp. Q54]